MLCIDYVYDSLIFQANRAWPTGLNLKQGLKDPISNIPEVV